VTLRTPQTSGRRAVRARLRRSVEVSLVGGADPTSATAVPVMRCSDPCVPGGGRREHGRPAAPLGHRREPARGAFSQPRSRVISGSTSGSAATVAAIRLPKYSISTAVPTVAEAGSQA
jgi:hypothetical protein